MKTIRAAAVAATLLLTASATGAQAGDLYGGMDYMRMTYEENGISESVNPDGVQFRLGSFIDPAIALEGRVGLGLGETSFRPMPVSVPGGTVMVSPSIKIDSFFSGYIRPELPLGEAFHIYGLAGFTAIQTTGKGSVGGFSATATESGTEFSYGAGATFKIDKTVWIQAEYQSLVDNGDVTLNSLNVGVNVRF